RGGGNVDRLREKIASIRERRARLEEARKTLEASGEDQLSLTDPDARAMHSSSRVGVGYNVQIAVDTKHKLIAEAEVHNKVSDLGLLAETAEAARDALGVERIGAVADRGYFKIEDIEACETAGITPLVPKPVRGSAAADGLYTKDRFRYDAEADTYTCPADQILRFRGHRPVREGVRLAVYANSRACKECALKTRCTNAAGRVVTRYENEAVLERMADRLAARPEVLDRRRETVEHPFGSIKQWMGQGAFLMRRLENVRAEFSLTTLVYNIRRAITLVGVPALIAAVRA
ncbi:MAG: transposase, partial [Pseudomonadota bacterium]